MQWLGNGAVPTYGPATNRYPGAVDRRELSGGRPEAPDRAARRDVDLSIPAEIEGRKEVGERSLSLLP